MYMKLENTKKAFIKNVKEGKNENYLNISTPRLLAVSSELTNNDYPKIYLDEINNLVFERI
jgi:L-rhamnose mutarotase